MLSITMYFMSEYDFRYVYECIAYRPRFLKMCIILNYTIISYAPTKSILSLDLNLQGQLLRVFDFFNYGSELHGWECLCLGSLTPCLVSLEFMIWETKSQR